MNTKALAKELRRLEATRDDQPIARRNGRRRVFAEMRKLRNAIDKTYPAIAKPRDVVRRTPDERFRALVKTGWVCVDRAGAGRYALLGVPVKHVKGVTGKVGTFSPVLVPEWAVAIGTNDEAKLRRAVKSRDAQKAAVVEAALKLT